MEEEMQLEQTKADVYETWAAMNRSFERIVCTQQTGKESVLKGDYVQDQSTITNNLWAKLNSQIMDEVGKREGGRPQPLRQNESHD